MRLSWVSSLTLTAHHKFFIDFIFENYVDLTSGLVNIFFEVKLL
jgi:hypothetical protein